MCVCTLLKVQLRCTSSVEDLEHSAERGITILFLIKKETTRRIYIRDFVVREGFSEEAFSQMSKPLRNKIFETTNDSAVVAGPQLFLCPLATRPRANSAPTNDNYNEIRRPYPFFRRVKNSCGR